MFCPCILGRDKSGLFNRSSDGNLGIIIFYNFLFICPFLGVVKPTTEIDIFQHYGISQMEWRLLSDSITNIDESVFWTMIEYYDA